MLHSAHATRTLSARRAVTLLTALLLTLLTPWESAAQAKDGQPRLRRASRLTEEAQKQRIAKLMSAGDKEALMVTLDRVILRLTRDLNAELSAGRSPLMIKGIGVRAPLSATLADCRSRARSKRGAV